MLPAVFLDRDGVLIEFRENYIRQWSDVVFIPGSLQALAELKNFPCRLFIITNQSLIGRGLITLQQAVEINQKILGVVELAGGRVDEVFLCPHRPEENCSCRKPKPGMIMQAAEKYALDLAHSMVVGDSLSDLDAGKAAGIPHRYLVRTGRGTHEEGLLDFHNLQDLIVMDDFAGAARHFLSCIIYEGKAQPDRLEGN